MTMNFEHKQAEWPTRSVPDGLPYDRSPSSDPDDGEVQKAKRPRAARVFAHVKCPALPPGNSTTDKLLGGRAADAADAEAFAIRAISQWLMDALMLTDEYPTSFILHLALALHTYAQREQAKSLSGKRNHHGAAGVLAPWQEQRAKKILGEVPCLYSVEYVANACGLSTSQFSRAFKLSTGATPGRWQRSQRIERSKTLIRDTTLPLAEIAMKCGFSEQCHFTHAFTKAEGISPGAMRILEKAHK